MAMVPLKSMQILLLSESVMYWLQMMLYEMKAL